MGTRHEVGKIAGTKTIGGDAFARDRFPDRSAHRSARPDARSYKLRDGGGLICSSRQATHACGGFVSRCTRANPCSASEATRRRLLRQPAPDARAACSPRGRPRSGRRAARRARELLQHVPGDRARVACQTAIRSEDPEEGGVDPSRIPCSKYWVTTDCYSDRSRAARGFSPARATRQT
jgi:hypothetical protein